MYFWILPYIIYILAQIVLTSEWHADKEIIQLRIKGTCLLVLLFNNSKQSLISYSLWMGGERNVRRYFLYLCFSFWGLDYIVFTSLFISLFLF